ncbi:MAG: hypothetical protein WCS94_12230 [Verrucomicrobiota bacterium]
MADEKREEVKRLSPFNNTDVCNPPRPWSLEDFHRLHFFTGFKMAIQKKVFLGKGLFPLGQSGVRQVVLQGHMDFWFPNQAL